MPYSKPSDAPSYVPKKYQAAWVRAWNYAHKKWGTEGRAFKYANGVVKKLKGKK